MDTAAITLERDPTTGHFLRGNQMARGNSRSDVARGHELRRAMLAAVTPEDMAEIARALVAEAKGGNVFAASLLFDRVIGKVKQAEPENADDLRETLRELWATFAKKPVTDPAAIVEVGSPA